MSKQKRKRTSNKEYWCSVHGRMSVFQKGGHRRKCRAPEGKPAAAYEGTGDGGADGKYNRAEELVRDVRTHLAGIDERLAQIKGEIKAVEKEAAKKTSDLGREHDALVSDRKKLLGALKNVN